MPLFALLLPMLLAVGATAAADAQPTATELLDAITIDGFRVDDDPPAPSEDLTWSGFSGLAGGSTDIDASPEDLADFRSGIRSWFGDNGDIVVVMVSTLGDDESASGIVNGTIDASRSSGTAITP